MIDLVTVGTSLGGLAALETLLAGLPDAFATPIVVVQHRRADGPSTLAALLARRTPRPVVEPDDGDPIEPRVVYLAPGGYHLLVERGRRFALSTEGPVAWARPSIDVLFESAAEACGEALVAVLLTCSSEDGAAGIAAVARHGGVTVVEDPASALSPVASRAALARVPSAHVAALADVAPLLVRLAGGSRREDPG